MKTNSIPEGLPKADFAEPGHNPATAGILPGARAAKNSRQLSACSCRRSFILLVIFFASIRWGDSARAQGGALVNDGANAGIIGAGATNTWTFTAAAGDQIFLRLGTTNFSASLSLQTAGGLPLAASAGGSDAVVPFTVTNAGSYSALVTSASQGGSGSYVLYFAQIPEPFSVPLGGAGGPLVNGGDNVGTLPLAGLQMWTFTAKAGDNVALRMVTTNFNAAPSLYSPSGMLIYSTCCSASGDTIIDSFTATNSGTYTVLVQAANQGGLGSYRLRLAEFSQPFTVAAAPLTNGNNAGSLGLGGLDRWTFTAKAGDNVVLRMVTTNFNAGPRLYDPSGVIIASECCAPGGDTIIDSFTATNSGTYTVLVQAANEGGAGSYILRLAEFSQPFTVAAAPLTNGDNAGLLGLGFLDRWTFAAKAGDSVALRMFTTNFNAGPSLYDPSGALLASTCCAAGGDTIIDAFTVTNSGTYTVLVDAANEGGVGSYVLRLAEFSQPFSVPASPLTNGGDNAGSLVLGGLDRWTFTAKPGDNFVLRMVTTKFNGASSLYDPSGVLLGSWCCAVTGDTIMGLFTATNSGNYTVLVDAASQGGAGPYTLRLAEFSQPFSVPAAPLANGGDNAGSLGLGALDRWTFTAKAGDNVVLRIVTTNFDAAPSLYSPTGVLLVSTCCAASGDTIIDSFTATTSGSYTVLVQAAAEGGVGTYILRLANLAQPFSVASFPLSNSASIPGMLGAGALDRWEFTACVGDWLYPQFATTNFTGNLGLYGPDGTLLAPGFGTNINFALQATNCGTFTLLVTSAIEGGTGAYNVFPNGLSDGPKLCPPVIAAPVFSVTAVGGPTNSEFILYTTTNVPAPAGLWTSIYTNRFDQFGVFNYTNSFAPSPGKAFFQLLHQ